MGSAGFFDLEKWLLLIFNKFPIVTPQFIFIIKIADFYAKMTLKYNLSSFRSFKLAK